MRLEAKNLSFQYDNGNRNILNHSNLTLDSGEYLGLTASSGSGRTTCCKILTGYAKPDEGDVYMDGIPLSSLKGYYPVQMVWRHPELSVNLKPKMREVLKEGDRLGQRMIDSLGIEKGWLDRYPGELSGEELQRLCTTRVLGERTRFLLADEINTTLDLVTQNQIWNFLTEETRKREIGLLVVSHSEGLLKRVCTRIQNLRGES